MYTIKNYQPDFSAKLAQLIENYSQKTPAAKILPVDFYTFYPAFESGKNILCAFDEAENLLAFAPLLPVPVNEDSNPGIPHNIWTVITVDPSVNDKYSVREELFEKVLQRALEIKNSLSQRNVRLCSDLFASQKAEIDYFTSKGFINYENAFLMRRDLQKPIPDLSIPDGIKVRHWKMETIEEQLKYIKADNLAFERSPRALEGLQSFLKSPEMAVGTTISAFDEKDEVIGSVTVYWNEENNRRNGEMVGSTEFIFVLAPWRGKGLAKYLIKEGLLYLKEHGIKEARLEVLAENRNALGLYNFMGYEVLKEELFLGMII